MGGSTSLAAGYNTRMVYTPDDLHQRQSYCKLWVSHHQLTTPPTHHPFLHIHHSPGLECSIESFLPGVRRLVESRTPKREGRHVVSSLSLLPIIMQKLKHTWTGHHLPVPTFPLFGKQYINLLLFRPSCIPRSCSWSVVARFEPIRFELMDST